MKKSKLFLATMTAFLVAGGLCLSGLKTQKMEAAKAIGGGSVSYKAEDWTYYGSGSRNDYWRVNADNFEFLGNGAFTDHMLVTDQFDTAVANYTVSASFVGTYNVTPIAKEIHAGLVPWYVDSNNWLIVYAQWWNPGGEARLETEMREVSIFAKINGSEFVYFMSYEDGWDWHNSTCWHDKWTNGNGLLPVNGFNLSVTKSRLVEAGVASDWIDITISTIDKTTWSTSTYHGEWKFRDTANAANRYAKPKVGLYCNNDAFTISDLAFTLDGYTTQSADGFLSSNAYSFLETVSDTDVCDDTKANPQSTKTALETAYGALTSKDLASLANVTYNGGKQNVLSAYTYYVGYAESLIPSGSSIFLGSMRKESNVMIIVIAISIAAVLGFGIIATKKHKKNK